MKYKCPLEINHIIVRLDCLGSDGVNEPPSASNVLNGTQAELSGHLSFDLPITSEAECSRKYFSVQIDGGHICAGGEQRKDICTGDSGGPLIISRFNKTSKELLSPGGDSPMVLVGITSFGPKSECGTGIPSGFTRVSHYEEWIKSKIYSD